MAIGETKARILAEIGRLPEPPAGAVRSWFDPAWQAKAGPGLQRVQCQAKELARKHPRSPLTDEVWERCRGLHIPLTPQDDEVAAKFQQFAQVHGQLRPLKPGAKIDCANKDYAARNQRTIGLLKDLLAAMLKAAPQHPATVRAQAMAADVNLK